MNFIKYEKYFAYHNILPIFFIVIFFIITLGMPEFKFFTTSKRHFLLSENQQLL